MKDGDSHFVPMHAGHFLALVPQFKPGILSPPSGLAEVPLKQNCTWHDNLSTSRKNHGIHYNLLVHRNGPSGGRAGDGR